MLELITEDVLKRPFRRAIKTAPTRIKPVTEQDVALLGPTFCDLEGRKQRIEIDRYLCVGIQGERCTCSERSMSERIAISGPDAEGFCLYHQREPRPVLVTCIDEPFRLTLKNEVLKSQAGAITWNGRLGDQLTMRVVAKSIFVLTYEFLKDDSEIEGHSSLHQEN